MVNRYYLLLTLCLMALPISQSAFAQAKSEATPAEVKAPSLLDKIGMNYFLFFSGPGFAPGMGSINPNQLGRPTDDGLNLFHIVSLRGKFWDNLALDVQIRGTVLFNNATKNPKFTPWRRESPRVGVSGKLLSGKTWALTGAINTDLPYFMPAPLSGYTTVQRKVLANPGLFGNLSWKPEGSRWSLFSVLAPRYILYADRDAAEFQFIKGGFVARNKPELSLAVLPTLSYQVYSKLSASLGTAIDYRKQVLSSWNPFRISLVNNGTNPAWRLQAIPIMAGMTYELNSAFRIFPYVQTFPISAQRVDSRTGKTASLLDASSFGMWISGTIL